MHCIVLAYRFNTLTAGGSGGECMFLCPHRYHAHAAQLRNQHASMLVYYAAHVSVSMSCAWLRTTEFG